MLINVQINGRTEKEQKAAAAGGSHVELRNMCSAQSLPCGCGQSLHQCQGQQSGHQLAGQQLSGHQLAGQQLSGHQQLSGQGAAIPVVDNRAYDASSSFVMRDNQAPPNNTSGLLPPPPPPPYPSAVEVRAKVKSIHEYDYIKPQ